MEKRKFRLADVVLSVICVVFVAEAAAPVASIGNSQYFWWLFMIAAFLLPYGLISSELGTAFPGDGGLYDWIHTAWPDSRWGARASWYYWINFPLWMASLAVMCPELLGYVFGWQPGPVWSLLIQLAFIWIVTVVAFYPVCDSIIILNLSAAIKILLAVTVGVLGIVYVAKNGFVNDMTARTFLPSFDLNSLSYISVILFNFLGFEVVCTFAKDMENPARDIPKAIIMGGLAIGAIYLFCGFGIGAAIPADQIDPDFGMIVAVMTMVGEASPIFIVIAIVFLITLFANMASWSFGVNAVAEYAAKNQNMLKVFAHENPKTGMPTGAAVVNGIVASAVLLIQLIPDESISQGLFWTLFATSVVFLLLTYIPMFPAFIKLRKVDANRPRVYRFPFQGTAMKVILAIPMIELVLAIVATIVPLSGDEVADKVPMLIIFLVFLAMGEVVRIVSACGRKEEFKGLTPETAAARLAEEAAGAPDQLEPADPAQIEAILAANNGEPEKVL